MKDDNKLKISEASLEDYSEVVHLFNRNHVYQFPDGRPLTVDDLDLTLKVKEVTHLFLLKNHGVLIGTSAFFKFITYGCLDWNSSFSSFLLIDSKSRSGQAITYLYKTILKKITKLKFSNIYTEISNYNKPSLALSKLNGFKEYDKTYEDILHCRSLRSHLPKILKTFRISNYYGKTYDISTFQIMEEIENPLEEETEIMTTFKDGKMPELVEQKDVSLDISDLNKGQFESIRLNKTTTDLKTTLTAKTGKVELDMYFKDKKSAKENIEKIYFVQNGKPQELPKFKNYFDLVERSSNGYYIYNGAINLKFKLSDKASLKVIYKGDKDPYSHQKEDMTKKGEQLSHSTQANENTAKVTFANIDWSHYSKVTVNDKEDIKSRTAITLNKGWVTLVFSKKVKSSTFAGEIEKDKRLRNISKIPISSNTQRSEKRIKDFISKYPMDGYIETEKTLILRINLTADTKLNFNAVKGASALTENMMMRQFAVAGPQDDPVSEHKYPSVFLLTPALLETASEATLNGKEITASGIIGHIRHVLKNKLKIHCHPLVTANVVIISLEWLSLC